MYQRIGDSPEDRVSLRDAITSEPVKTVSALAMTYHGYKRSQSVLWAITWGLLGRWFPIVTVPISIAQGFGKEKGTP